MNAALALLITGAEVAPICTDRPTKANAVCTVPEGAWQIETSVAGWSLTKASGTDTEIVSIGSTFAKLGLSGRSDLQVGFSPFARLTTRAAGDHSHASGFGDILVRYKNRVTAASAPAQVAIIPYVKLPTASDGLGNGKLEAGLAIPISLTITGSATITLGPEVALLADADGKGGHAAIVNLINVSGSIAKRLTVAGEIWSNFNLDPAGSVRQASADAALTYSLSPGTQIDLGANLGLTRANSDIELYAGVSFRL